MNVGELKAILHAMPDHMLVLVSGYEGGFISPSNISTGRVEVRENKRDYMGTHESAPTLAEEAEPDDERDNSVDEFLKAREEGKTFHAFAIQR